VAGDRGGARPPSGHCRPASEPARSGLLGNHDARFEANLANNASRYRNIKGVHLSDHFGLWEKGWSCAVNSLIESGRTIIKHKPKGGGMNAARASTLNGGVSFVHGHLHSQKVSPITDYNGDRYGVDAGMVADPSYKQFVNYTEDAPLDWRSGFCILTYKDGKLMAPDYRLFRPEIMWAFPHSLYWRKAL
jgi:hypothetical protein